MLAARVAWSHCRRTIAWIAAMWGGCAVTHPLLDALTDGGAGVMLLFPISDARLFFPEDRPDALTAPMLEFWDELPTA